MYARLRKVSPLTALEVTALVGFGVLAIHTIATPERSPVRVPLNGTALATGPANERWMGIYFEDQPVGYAVESRRPTQDGQTLIASRSVFRLASMGEIQAVATSGTALLDAERQLVSFDIVLSSGDVNLAARGRVVPGGLQMEVFQAGETRVLELPMEEPPQISLSFATAIEGRTLAVGDRFDLPWFDPVTLSQDRMQIGVTDVELIPGTAEEAYWLDVRVGEVRTRRLVTPSGDVLREEGGLGLSMVRMSREEAEGLASQSPGVDLIALAAIPVETPIDRARDAVAVDFEVSGAARIPHDPPLQTVDGVSVRIRVPLEAEIPALPLLASPTGHPEVDDALAPTFLLPSTHEEIRQKAIEVTGGATSRREAARRLTNWVFTSVEKRPVLGVPHGLEVLRRLEGDCNEHTALYVSLARAAGVPARIAAGLVYTDRMSGEPAFYYHAWPEVHLGGTPAWVPVDPTFGQFPADATHLKLVEGGLDRQVEIAGTMGRIRIAVQAVR
ncbi:MAG: transglutaminase domain-containing protein [Deltaproteobacteria bacterium]|nr:transglutaminase domain-containing protein [Deltaproteobacteria bacterium]